MNEEIAYIKTKKSNILKCYISEQMHKPIYYPVDSKTNGYVDYYEVEKFLKIDDMYSNIKDLQQENTILKENAKHNDKVVDKVNWENNLLKQQLKDKDEKISKIIELLKNPSNIEYEMYGLEYSRDIVDIELLLKILENNKED